MSWTKRDTKSSQTKTDHMKDNQSIDNHNKHDANNEADCYCNSVVVVVVVVVFAVAYKRNCSFDKVCHIVNLGHAVQVDGSCPRRDERV